MTLRNQHIQKKSLILKSQVYPLANLDSPLKVNWCRAWAKIWGPMVPAWGRPSWPCILPVTSQWWRQNPVGYLSPLHRLSTRLRAWRTESAIRHIDSCYIQLKATPDDFNVLHNSCLVRSFVFESGWASLIQKILTSNFTKSSKS